MQYTRRAERANLAGMLFISLIGLYDSPAFCSDQTARTHAAVEPEELLSIVKARDKEFDGVLVKIETSESMKPLLPILKRLTPQISRPAARQEALRPVPDPVFSPNDYSRLYTQTILLFGNDRAYIREQDPSMFASQDAPTTPWGEERARLIWSTKPDRLELYIESTTSPTVYYEAESASHRFDLVLLSAGIGFFPLIDTVTDIVRDKSGWLIRGTCNPNWGARGSTFDALYDDDLIIRKLEVRSTGGSDPRNILRLTTAGTIEFDGVPKVAESCTLEGLNEYLRQGQEPLKRWWDDYQSKTVEIKWIDKATYCNTVAYTLPDDAIVVRSLNPVTVDDIDREVNRRGGMFWILLLNGVAIAILLIYSIRRVLARRHRE